MFDHDVFPIWLAKAFKHFPIIFDLIYLEPKLISVPFLWYWAVWECAQLCINSRLKTPFGKPQDTFLTIEAEIKALSHESQSNEILHGEKGTKLIASEWFRVRWLLVFVEILDKQLYNAYEGTAFALPSPSKKEAKIFFRTNKSTCKEWLNRLRFALMNVALKNGLHSMVIRLMWQFFFDVEYAGLKAPDNLEHILLITIEAFLALQDEQGLLGLYAKVKKLLNQKLHWIKICADEAAQRYEKAAKEASDLLENQVLDLEKKIYSTTILKHLQSQVIRCSAKVCDWKYIVSYKAENGMSNFSDVSESNQHVGYAFIMNELTSMETIKNLSARETHKYMDKEELFNCWIQNTLDHHFRDSIQEILVKQDSTNVG
uniref:Uncharacterized protein n=1 Tax=Romanomermis culicivorax TaxID=13658 RepID=A0A915JT02_ROMCU